LNATREIITQSIAKKSERPTRAASRNPKYLDDEDYDEEDSLNGKDKRKATVNDRIVDALKYLGGTATELEIRDYIDQLEVFSSRKELSSQIKKCLIANPHGDWFTNPVDNTITDKQIANMVEYTLAESLPRKEKWSSKRKTVYSGDSSSSESFSDSDSNPSDSELFVIFAANNK